VLSNKDCCEGSCVHQELSGSGLRRGDLHHVACWIRSSSSGDVHRVIGRIAIDLLSGRLAVKDRDKTHRITGVILIKHIYLPDKLNMQNIVLLLIPKRDTHRDCNVPQKVKYLISV
jgi:hypothetical protein